VRRATHPDVEPVHVLREPSASEPTTPHQSSSYTGTGRDESST